MVAPAAHPDPADAADADARRCIRCDYLLIGLPADGACPECGTPVVQSLAPVNLLRDQDPAWLGRVAEGFMWQIGANLVAVTSVLGHVFAGWQQAQAVGADRAPLPTILDLLLVLLNFVAAWRISTPEPGVVEPALSLRRAIRLVTCMWVPATLLNTFDPFASTSHWVAVFFAAALLGLVDLILWYTYVRRLALRVPSAGLAFQSLLLLCGWGIIDLFTWVLPSIGYVLYYYAGIYVGDVYSFAWGAPAVVINVALTLYAAYFCFRVRRAIVREASLAAAPGVDETAAGI
jgi:hypothetical protein